MAWQDRLSQAAYTGATSNTRLTFDYEDVSLEATKKTTAFNFPDANGTFVQDLGAAGKKFPLRVFLWGNDYDLKADNFIKIISEKGPGKLEHPLYGVITVVPFGSITRRDDLKTAANQAVIEVTFWETLTDLYPLQQTNFKSAVIGAIEDYTETQIQYTSSNLELDSVVNRTIFNNEIVELISTARQFIRPLITNNPRLLSIFDFAYTAITSGITSQTVQTTLAQVISLFQTPAQGNASPERVQAAYQNNMNSVINAPDAVLPIGYKDENDNLYYARELIVNASVSSQALAAAFIPFNTKTESDQYAYNLLTQFDSINEWAGNNQSSLQLTDTGESYQVTLDVVGTGASLLINEGFSLLQERRLVLDRNRTIIDLVYELYGSVDENLDSFINANNLTGSQILELTKGLWVKYYV